MKVKSLLFMFGLATCLAGCQNDFVQELEKEEPLKGGNEIIFVGGENGKVLSRSGKETVFEGGVATGAGLYHASQRPPVTATANPGYVIDKFHGGPVKGDLYTYNHTEHKKTASFKVDMTLGDNQFEVSFKKNMKQVTISAGTGGTVTPSGTIERQAEKAHSITATPNSGYTFTGWSVGGTGITMGSTTAANTTFTLSPESSGGTITANFQQNALIQINLNVSTRSESGGIGERNFITYSSNANLSVKYNFESTVRRDDGSSDTNYWSSTYSSGQEIENYYYYNDGYGNEERTRGTLESITITYNGEVVYTGSTLPSDGYTSGKYIIKR